MFFLCAAPQRTLRPAGRNFESIVANGNVAEPEVFGLVYHASSTGMSKGGILRFGIQQILCRAMRTEPFAGPRSRACGRLLRVRQWVVDRF